MDKWDVAFGNAAKTDKNDLNMVACIYTDVSGVNKRQVSPENLARS